MTANIRISTGTSRKGKVVSFYNLQKGEEREKERERTPTKEKASLQNAILSGE